LVLAVALCSQQDVHHRCFAQLVCWRRLAQAGAAQAGWLVLPSVFEGQQVVELVLLALLLEWQ